MMKIWTFEIPCLNTLIHSDSQEQRVRLLFTPWDIGVCPTQSCPALPCPLFTSSDSSSDSLTQRASLSSRLYHKPSPPLLQPPLLPPSLLHLINWQPATWNHIAPPQPGEKPYWKWKFSKLGVVNSISDLTKVVKFVGPASCKCCIIMPFDCHQFLLVGLTKILDCSRNLKGCCSIKQYWGEHS